MHRGGPTPDILEEDSLEWREATGKIIACAMTVHSILGPGLLEKIYEEALEHELKLAGIPVVRQVSIRIPYKDILLSEQKMDMIVDSRVLLELRAVDKVPDLHLAQLVSYLRATGLQVGLLINFNVLHLRDGLYRRANSRPRAGRTTPVPIPSASSASSAFKPLSEFTR